MATQTIQFDSVSLSEIGSGTITAFLYSGTTLAATLASITENGTLKGRFTGTVEDIAAGDYTFVCKFDGYTVSEAGESVSLLLVAGTYTVTAPGGGGGEGGTDWTSEQRTYILGQLALLTVSGAMVVVTAGERMCARGDVEQVYGNTNVAKWADLNNNANADEILSRINYHIAMADNYIRAAIGNGAWVMPEEGDTIPAILAYNCARLTGVLLYEARGVSDYDSNGRPVHQLMYHKKSVDDFLKGVLVGSVSLSPLTYSITNAAPEAS